MCVVLGRNGAIAMSVGAASGMSCMPMWLIARNFDSTLLAKQPGFSLHAATVCEANQRDELEKLCRYITRPAIANERLSTNEHGQVLYKFKQPFRDGATHVLLDPLDFIVRLAALVPRPRFNLTRFHGVFAPYC